METGSLIFNYRFSFLIRNNNKLFQLKPTCILFIHECLSQVNLKMRKKEECDIVSTIVVEEQALVGMLAAGGLLVQGTAVTGTVLALGMAPVLAVLVVADQGMPEVLLVLGTVHHTPVLDTHLEAEPDLLAVEADIPVPGNPLAAVLGLEVGHIPGHLADLLLVGVEPVSYCPQLQPHRRTQGCIHRNCLIIKNSIDAPKRPQTIIFRYKKTLLV